jgi:hypothetical protein
MNTITAAQRLLGSLLAACTLFSGCTGVDVVTKEAPELAALRASGYRVAVMPFAVSAPMDGFVTDALGPVGEVLALSAAATVPVHDQVGSLMRQQAVVWLQQSAFTIVDPWHVDTQLAHAGIDAAAARDPDNARRIAALLAVDGLVYGDVQRWNRSYYVLQSTIEVALGLTLRDAMSGTSLFTSERVERLGSGLTGGPTGYVSAATEPVAGLRGSQLVDLTRAVTRHTVVDLNGGMLGSDAGASAPRLSLVSLLRPHELPFAAGERIEVVAVGTPDCDVRFDLGRLRTAVPMVETERHADPRGERATYRGHYVVDAVDVASGLVLSATIQRGGARRGAAVHYAAIARVDLGRP